MKSYQFPEKYTPWIEQKINALGYSLSRPEALASAIKEVSDHFISQAQRTTPWGSPASQAAYLSYYFPLNYVRSLKVVDEAQRLGFFSNPPVSIDFGCGPGTLTRVLKDQGLEFENWIGIDKDPATKAFFPEGPQYQCRQDKPPLLKPFMLSMGYALNELPHAPEWFYKAETLLIIEPSSHQESQNLQEYRQHLIDKGYFIWGPCLHQDRCPLLAHKKDWCHDRVYWEPPGWFEELSHFLPMNNKTLAFSYILASRKEPPKPQGLRIIGDARVEKGKTRWQVCDVEQRRFLSALHRNGEPPRLYRGDIYLDALGELKGNEWRIPKKLDSEG